MNRTYRNIWNETLGTWVAASEITSARGKGSSAVSAKLLISVLLISATPSALAGVYSFSSGACNYAGGTGPDGTRTYSAGTAPIDGNGGFSSVAGCSANGNNLLGVTLYGSNTTATGNGAVAFGMGASAGNLATALGLQATASGTAALALGYNATASAAYGVAIGSSRVSPVTASGLARLPPVAVPPPRAPWRRGQLSGPWW